MLRLGILGAVLIVGAIILGSSGFGSHPAGWPLFIAATILGFFWQFGRHGAGHWSPTLSAVGAIGTMITWVLLFILVGWKGGVASILGGFGGGFVGTLSMGLIRGRIEL